MEDRVAAGIWQRRVGGALFVLFAVLTMSLSTLGLYGGVLAYLVMQPWREIGVRMALGASPAEMRWLVVARDARLIAAGIVVGLALSLGVSRSLAPVLFESTRADLLAWLAAPLLLMLVAFAACYLPARRATTIDPLDALRAEWRQPAYRSAPAAAGSSTRL